MNLLLQALITFVKFSGVFVQLITPDVWTVQSEPSDLADSLPISEIFSGIGIVLDHFVQSI